MFLPAIETLVILNLKSEVTIFLTGEEGVEGGLEHAGVDLHRGVGIAASVDDGEERFGAHSHDHLSDVLRGLFQFEPVLAPVVGQREAFPHDVGHPPSVDGQDLLKHFLVALLKLLAFCCHQDSLRARPRWLRNTSMTLWSRSFPAVTTSSTRLNSVSIWRSSSRFSSHSSPWRQPCWAMASVKSHSMLSGVRVLISIVGLRCRRWGSPLR